MIEVGGYVRTIKGSIGKITDIKKHNGMKNTYNGHLWAQCENCKMNVIQ